MVRRDLLVEQFQRAVTGSALVRDWDTARLAALTANSAISTTW